MGVPLNNRTIQRLPSLHHIDRKIPPRGPLTPAKSRVPAAVPDSVLSHVCVPIPVRVPVRARVRVPRHHLYRNNTAKRTSPSGVLAANETNVILTSHGPCALLALGNASNQRVVRLLAVPVPPATTRDVLRDGDVLPGSRGPVVIDHAAVGARAVGVHLVERHADLPAWGDLGEVVAHLGHDGQGTGFDVVVARAEGLADGVGGVAAEAGGVLLEGAAARAVTGRGGVDAECHTRAAGVTSGRHDGAVAGYEVRGKEDEGDERRFERHFAGLRCKSI